MSAAGFEFLFNAICFGIAIIIGGFTIFMYRQVQPKFYGLLLWALFLTLGAALTYGMYSALLVEFLNIKSADEQVIVVSSRLSDNIRLLAFVVPGLMLAVAANLITIFLQAPTPVKK